MNIKSNGDSMQQYNSQVRNKLFVQLVTPCLRFLRGYTMRLTQNSADSEDLQQDVLLNALRKLDQFQIGSDFQAWLSTMTFNLFVNSYRRKRRASDVISPIPLEDYVDDLDCGSIAVRDESYQSIHESLSDEMTVALSKLNDDFKTVMILADIECWSFDEIAAFMGSPVNTAKSRAARARHQMANFLKAA